jgi:hypothetical protein
MNMKLRLILAIGVVFAGATSSFAQGNNQVQGYTRQDGTYVQPHYRTNPDNNRLNNYGTQGNVNPYTGQAGTVNPYAQPNPYGNNAAPNAFGSPYGSPRRN